MPSGGNVAAAAACINRLSLIETEGLSDGEGKLSSMTVAQHDEEYTSMPDAATFEPHAPRTLFSSAVCKFDEPQSPHSCAAARVTELPQPVTYYPANMGAS